MSSTTHTTTPAFQRGISWGKRGIFRGNLSVDFALEGHLTEEQLRQDVGIVVGVVSSNPHVFCSSKG